MELETFIGLLTGSRKWAAGFSVGTGCANPVRISIHTHLPFPNYITNQDDATFTKSGNIYGYVGNYPDIDSGIRDFTPILNAAIAARQAQGAAA